MRRASMQHAHVVMEVSAVASKVVSVPQLQPLKARSEWPLFMGCSYMVLFLQVQRMWASACTRGNEMCCVLAC